MTSKGLPLFLCALSLFSPWAAPARAAEPRAPEPAPELSIVPPRLLSTPDVPYPEGARGDSVVVLILLVGKDGSVTEAHATSDDPPFSDAAEAAARTFRFAPATRGGRAIPARIRFEIRFLQPRPAPLPEAPTVPASPQREAGTERSRRAPTGATEVTVHGARAPVGTTTLTRAEVRQLPGAFGDPFRAIEALPGVTPIVSGLPFFYVRGAPPGNVGYFLDGIRVPYLYHVGLGPSVVHPGMVDRVDLYPGGYPAAFGRFAGGVVAAETTTPQPSLHGEGNLRLFDVGALVETGFADGRGTALAAGRYSYTAAILSLIAKDITLDYRDYAARVTYDVTRDDRVSLVSFGSYDLLGQTQNGIFTVLFGSEFYRGDLRWDHQLASGGTLRADVTLGLDQTRIPDQPRNSRDGMVSTRVFATQPLSHRVLLRVGTDVTFDAYRADLRPYSDPDDPVTQRFNALFPPRNDLAIGTFGDVVIKAGIAEITPGVRIDLFDSGGAAAVGVDPRVASRLDVAPKVHVLHTFGVAHQPPSFIIPIPGLAVGQLQGGLQTSLQSSAGVEVELPEDTTATVTVFDNVFLNMSDTLSVGDTRGRNVLKEPRSLGSAVGAELYVRRKLTHRLGGYLSYTLSRSTRSIGADHFPSAFDRTHVGNAALAYDLGRNWRAGSRLTVYTGIPKVPTASNGLVPPPRSANPERDPAFYRLDLRLEKRWMLSKSAWLAFVAEMMNATLHKEVVAGREIGPVTIPSIGLEGGF